jgi:hypothetical protein
LVHKGADKLVESVELGDGPEDRSIAGVVGEGAMELSKIEAELEERSGVDGDARKSVMVLKVVKKKATSAECTVPTSWVLDAADERVAVE